MMKQLLVSDCMTKDVITVESKTILPKAHRLMTEKQIRRLPVVDNGKLVGILTIGDVRGAEPSQATSLSIWEINYLLDQMQIRETMTRKPITINEQATIQEAAQKMLENRISGLPVVDKTGKLTGIITESDIFRFVVQSWNGAEPQITPT